MIRSLDFQDGISHRAAKPMLLIKEFRGKQTRMSLTSIQEKLRALNSTERMMLIGILWESLDEKRVNDIEAKWAAESEERIEAVDRGDLQTLDGPAALQHLRSSLTK